MPFISKDKALAAFEKQGMEIVERIVDLAQKEEVGASVPYLLGVLWLETKWLTF